MFAGQEPASSPISIIGEGREGSPASPGEGEAGKKKFKWNIKVGRGDVGHSSEDMRVQQGLQDFCVISVAASAGPVWMRERQRPGHRHAGFSWQSGPLLSSLYTGKHLSLSLLPTQSRKGQFEKQILGYSKYKRGF